MHFLSISVYINCRNLPWGLHLSFDLVTGILKLALACMHIAIIKHMCGLFNAVSLGRPYKYVGVTSTKVQLIDHKILSTMKYY